MWKTHRSLMPSRRMWWRKSSKMAKCPQRIPSSLMRRSPKVAAMVPSSSRARRWRISASMTGAVVAVASRGTIDQDVKVVVTRPAMQTRKSNAAITRAMGVVKDTAMVLAIRDAAMMAGEAIRVVEAGMVTEHQHTLRQSLMMPMSGASR